ncbi:DEAD/DEAH box helicase family protein [Thermodesulforhabdus norvegica]|uniref:Helicase/UvrB N-terminal domain-containing protein n=1 Tax=Thermodesulforhabdus norvegica TaxID=39841 RepID=A0A1I4QQR1_9BACT|nr:DEAD/DEAH box helicase family protein [Thermodesulforhabdus norvegica]SFM42367.1 hypothetical protein SAMN05660836_00171 [Thermodesulforhabdus norvegica]
MRSRVLTIQVGENLKIPISGLNPNLERRLFERLVMPNPEYEQRHQSGMWIGNIPPTISCIRRLKRTYALPRGFLPELISLCNSFRQAYKIVDSRKVFSPIFVDFHGYLKEYQQDAAEAILEKDFATIVGGYKSGKTVIALYTVAERKQPTLVIIPKLELLDGWIRKIGMFLQIPEHEIGRFIQGQKKLGSRITIAHSSEVLRHWRELQGHFGYVIFDDANRCPHRVLSQIMWRFDSKYTLGLCHELDPNDRLTQIITLYLGEVVYRIDPENAREGRGIIRAHVVAKTTEFTYPYTSRMDYLPMLQKLMEDEARNRQIASDVLAEVLQGIRPVALITGGPLQEEALYNMLLEKPIRVSKIIMPYDDITREASYDGVSPASSTELKIDPDADVYLLTSQTLIRCYAALNVRSLFLAVPLYFHVELAKAISHLAQECEKSGYGRLRIYDYVDSAIALLFNYFRMRSYNYGVPPETLLAKVAGSVQR